MKGKVFLAALLVSLELIVGMAAGQLAKVAQAVADSPIAKPTTKQGIALVASRMKRVGFCAFSPMWLTADHDI
jgi:hypothetical protein